MKGLTASILMLLGGSAVYAGAMGVASYDFNGAYAGLGTGYGTLFHETNATFMAGTIPSAPTLTRTVRYSDAAIAFDGHVGYGRVLPSSWYLGGKGSVYYTPVQQFLALPYSHVNGEELTVGSVSRASSVKPIYNIDGVLGYEIYPHLMPFVEGGVSFSNVRTLTTIRNSAVLATGDTFAQGSFQPISGYHTNYNLGIGASYQVSPNWFVSSEALYNYLGKYTSNNTLVGFSPTTQNTFQLASLMASVSYLIPYF